MKIYTLIGCMLLLFLVNNAVAQKNLVDNGDFEDDLTSWNANSAARTTPWDYKSGKNSCAITANDAENWLGIDQTVRIPKKAQALAFSAWLKGENIVKGKNDWNGGIFTIEFLDKYDKKIGDDINLITLSGDQPWTLVQKGLKIPDNAASFKIMIAMGYASGTMLIDNVTAKQINIDDLNK